MSPRQCQAAESYARTGSMIATGVELGINRSSVFRLLVAAGVPRHRRGLKREHRHPTAPAHQPSAPRRFSWEAALSEQGRDAAP